MYKIKFIIFLICMNSFLAIAKPTVNTSKTKTIDSDKLKKLEEVSNLKKNEYLIFNGESYDKFTTRKFEKLELTENCFKNKRRPKCEAYEFAQIKPKKLTMINDQFNNLAAIVCDAVFGVNLLALDFKKNEYNFCRFKDGSMVNSWSFYYKHFPNKEVE